MEKTKVFKRATDIIFTVLCRKGGVTPGKQGELLGQWGRSSWELQLVFNTLEAWENCINSLFRLKQCFEYLASISKNQHLIQSSHPSLILPASVGHEVRNMLLQEHTGACYSPPHSASKRPYSEKSVLPPRIALACPKCQPCYPQTQKKHVLFEEHSCLPSHYSLAALAP